MALHGKFEDEMEINMPASKFYNIWKNEGHHVPTAAPNRIHAVHVHEGDWGAAGSIKIWKYTVDGTTEVFKEKLEFDDETKSVSFVGLEGDVMKDYKVLKPKYQCISKGEGSCLLKMTLEYERASENIPTPDKYKRFMADLAKDIEEHHLKA
ncbi:MLP-like protein 28 [Quillaja saponaria]|uniref:MLP-like protein 28 n=1 Tax=Quillaja saponaria TaxID=32244 RepID=A0AAD7L9S9_QUISA|nr:MLP-like protein 28 [Quillaja saponaria]